MRALGGRQRPLRRRLRRIAIGIALAALVIGLPFGVAVSNLIARMVLQEFVGITPGFGIDIPVVAGSAIAVLIGARLVSARASRRVTTVPLATALRDRDGAPFGATRLQRMSTRVGLGGLVSRMAARTSLGRPGRTVAVVAQIAAAVGAAFLVPTLATSVNDYNTSAHAVWQWESLSVAADQGLPLTAAELDSGSSAEAGIWTSGHVAEWEMDVYGLRVDSTMIDPDLTDGAWLEAAGDAVVSAGFADRTGIEVGDPIEVALAAGSAEFVVTGLSDDSSRAIYVQRQRLSDELGEPGMANIVWSADPAPTIDTEAPLAVTTLDEVVEEDAAGTNAIVVIFGAIGVLVSSVAALAVLSSMTVSLFERRHEFAALQAFGARKRRLRGLLFRELLPLGVVGVGVGLVIGALGARGIIASFEASNAIDIGVTDATAAVPFIVLGTAAVLALLVTTVVRSAARRPIAVSLRGAA